MIGEWFEPLSKEYGAAATLFIMGCIVVILQLKRYFDREREDRKAAEREKWEAFKLSTESLNGLTAGLEAIRNESSRLRGEIASMRGAIERRGGRNG